MKAKELQLGDWVHSSFYGSRRITSLKEVEGYGWIMTTGEENWKSDASLSPIPLTPEILAKNGFEHTGKYYNNTPEPCAINAYWKKGHYPEDGYMITYHTKFDRCNSDMYKLKIYDSKRSDIVLRDIHYVHELQHALRLCGLTELADNFKV